MPDASESDPVSTKQQRIAELAKQAPQRGFTSLAHHIDLRWLYEAYVRTRQDGAVGVDGQTAADYAADLGGNLRSLLERAKSGTYRAPPVRRVHIPKGDSTTETRPIGIPTFEDKVLQRAVVMVLEAIYEQDFLPCSYGFRPRRSAHQALDELWQQTMGMGGGWVVEVDIRKFFDTLDHAHLRELLKLRVRDGVLLRLIGKWLNAGVLEDGEHTFPATGSPQGGVITPQTILQKSPLYSI
jgi:RNA-directed DNA polymerase